MKKIYKILIPLLVIILAIASAYTLLKFPNPAQQATIEDIHATQLNPSANYIHELQEVINSNQNASVREEAVLALADITIRRGETDLVIDFLKNLAYNEENDQVRSAAYAAVDLIRDIYPLEPKAALGLHIGGDFKKGGNMTLFAYINATENTEAKIGIDALQANLDLLSPSFVVTNVTANVPQEVQFKFHLTDIGDYVISVTLQISYDRLDYDGMTKKIFFRVHENYGEILSILDQ